MLSGDRLAVVSDQVSNPAHMGGIFLFSVAIPSHAPKSNKHAFTLHFAYISLFNLVCWTWGRVNFNFIYVCVTFIYVCGTKILTW